MTRRQRAGRHVAAASSPVAVDRRVVAVRAAGAAIGARLAYATLARRAGGSESTRWARTNYRDRPVSLLGGPAYAIGALAAAVPGPHSTTRVRAAAAVAGAAAAWAGGYDDLFGTTHARGLRGHLRALKRGEVTSGVVKLGAIGAGALLAGVVAEPGRWSRKLAAGTVIAATANLINLFDLRPGRAAKAGLLVACPVAIGGGVGAGVAAAAAGAAAGLLPADLGERLMLGDAGANTLGALVGVGLVAGSSARRLAFTAVAVLSLTAAAEFVSFSEVIEASGPLRRLDRWGRLGDG